MGSVQLMLGMDIFILFFLNSFNGLLLFQDKTDLEN